MLIKLATNKTVARLQPFCRPPFSSIISIAGLSRPAQGIAERGRSALMEEPKKMTGDSNEATRTRNNK